MTSAVDVGARAGISVDVASAASESVDEVLAELDSSRIGQTSAETMQRLTVCGHNVLVEHRVTMVGELLRQLRNPLLILLGAAAVVSAATGDPTDAIIIGLILALSVGLGSRTSTEPSGLRSRCIPASATAPRCGATVTGRLSTSLTSFLVTSSNWPLA